VTFAQLPPPLARALAERNYHEPTPVQAATLGEEAIGRDLLVSAQTGSGKTVAYGLAIAENLLGDSSGFEKPSFPFALIIAPTRELALQVHRELTWLYQHAGARVVSCVGGMDPRREQRALEAGAHIVVGTPGRLCDHLRRGRLDLSELKAIVLDEADEMLDLGFREDIEFILEAMPETRRTLLFSATLPRAIVALAKRYQRQALRIEVAGGEGGHADIEYRAIRIAAGDAEHAIVNLLRFFEASTAIIFCNTRDAVKHLQAALLERGFSVVALSGEFTQNERTNALQALRDGRARVCVATDVAARGIDLPNLELVIQADLPNDSEVLQHRSGRTGRAGRKGVSVLLVTRARGRRAEMLLSHAGVSAIWAPPPKAEEIYKLDQERMLQGPLFTEESTEDDLALARTLLAERSPEDIAAALARLYRARLPSPEEIADPGREDGRMRDVRARDARGAPTKQKAPGPHRRGGMADGSVWFRAAIGRKGKAEARSLLPMLCRRGGVEKNHIGAIRIFETTTEFEISAGAAESFAAKIRRPDKQDSIRIDPLPDGPQGETAPATAGASSPARQKHAVVDRGEKPAYTLRSKHERRPAGEAPPKSEFQRQNKSKPSHFEKRLSDSDVWPAPKPASKKKPKRRDKRPPPRT
jgi:ATP-dependent RNA helicase DeaD